MNPLYGKPIGSLTYGDVLSFVESRVPEHKRLEYKREFSQKDAGRAISKEVAALANSAGGLIIYGVEEAKGDRRPVENAAGFDLGSDARSRVLTSCSNRITPPVLIEVSELLSSDASGVQSFLVARVPESQEVHGVDDGTVVYVRTDEHSEAKPATIEQLERLFARKSANAIDQNQRRKLLGGRLLPLLEQSGQAVYFTASAGPLVHNQPLTTAPELLNARLPEFATKSAARHYSTIPVSDTAPIPILDGLYSAEGRAGQRAGAVDIFGNVCLVAQLATCPISDDELNSRDAAAAIRRDKEGRGLAIRDAALSEHVIALLESMRLVCRSLGYFGNLAVELRVENVKNLVVAEDRKMWGPIERGFCAVDDAVEFVEAIRTDSLESPDGWNRSLVQVLGRLLWALGVPHEEFVNHAAYNGERLFWGQDQCRCGSFYKPTTWETCLSCKEAGKSD